MTLVFIILGLGIVTIASATDADVYGMTRAVKLQIVGTGLGMAMVIILSFINYRFFGYIHWLIYALSIAVLILIFVPGVGQVRGGARSWIRIGGVFLQTSEFSKIGYIIFLSEFVKRRGGINTFMDLLLSGVTVLPLFGLVLLQRDLGTALVFFSIAFGIIFVSGARYWHILLLSATAAVTMPLIYSKLNPYQKNRLIAFMNQEDLSLPGNHHLHMSKISIGSGGMHGKKLFNGVFHKLDYLPVRESDFIFAVFVEEWGYMGGIFLIGIYCLLFLKLLINSLRVRKDLFASNIITGVLFMFGFQMFENIGMTMGVMPITGITLPFFSAGPSSLVASFIAIGLVQSVHIFRHRPAKVDL